MARLFDVDGKPTARLSRYRARLGGLWRSLVSALVWGTRGRRFKSSQPDHVADHVGERLATRPQRSRYVSVDSFRGLLLSLTVVAPIAEYPLLKHAEWNGITVTDTVFPAFLVTSGLSLSFLLRTPLKSAVPARLARRLLLLVALGLAYNAYGTTWFTLSDLRFTGVLQMIGISGACAAVLILLLRVWTGSDRVGLLMGVATAIVVAYGLGLEFGRSSCEPVGRCSGYMGIDAALLGASHLYRGGSAGHDPEGLMASLAAAAFVLVGFSAGTVLQRHGTASRSKTVTGVSALAVYCLAIGAALSVWTLPNKRLMTPAFVMLTSAVALATFAVLYLIIDARATEGTGERSSHARQRWTWPAVALGRNALLVYLLDRFLYQSARLVSFGDTSLRDLLLEDFLPFGIPRNYLVYAALVLAIIVVVTAALHRRRAYWAL